MAKNLVVCCDGTANEFKTDRTNVAKLCYAMEKDGRRQLVYYHPGLGTMAPPAFATGLGRGIARLAGLMFGYGIKKDIVDAYTFIMNHWEQGDQLFLLGFSRGSYTARVLAALLHMYGLAMPGNEPLIPYAVRMLWKIDGIRPSDTDHRSAYFALADDFKATLSGIPCVPHFLGVWDTVSSVGWIGSPTAIPFTRNNPDIEIARHAVAIDERRSFFRTNLLATPLGRNVRQVWFPGVHCDVGGGYAEASSGLSKIALKWMAEEAQAAGLLLDEGRLQEILGDGNDLFAKPDPNATLHNSMTPPWKLAEFVPKVRWDPKRKRKMWRANFFRQRGFEPSPIVHDAAWQRQGYASRLPRDARPLSQVWPTVPAAAPAPVPISQPSSTNPPDPL